MSTGYRGMHIEDFVAEELEPRGFKFKSYTHGAHTRMYVHEPTQTPFVLHADDRHNIRLSPTGHRRAVLQLRKTDALIADRVKRVNAKQNKLAKQAASTVEEQHHTMNKALDVLDATITLATNGTGYTPSVDGKICTKCGDWLPLTEFGTNRANAKDGLMWHCRNCERDRTKYARLPGYNSARPFTPARYLARLEQLGMEVPDDFRLPSSLKGTHAAEFYAASRNRQKFAQTVQTVVANPVVEPVVEPVVDEDAGVVLDVEPAPFYESIEVEREPEPEPEPEVARRSGTGSAITSLDKWLADVANDDYALFVSINVTEEFSVIKLGDTVRIMRPAGGPGKSFPVTAIDVIVWAIELMAGCKAEKIDGQLMF